MFKTASARRRSVVVLVGALTALVTLPTPASAVNDTTFEETASAFWSAPWECEDGTIVDGTLLVETTRFFESPETEDPNPTARIQFLALCPEGSVNWGRGQAPATITSTRISRASPSPDRPPSGPSVTPKITSSLSTLRGPAPDRWR